MADNRRKALSIVVSGGISPAVVIGRAGTVVRAVFDGPDAAKYAWIGWDGSSKPTNGRPSQVGDKIIGEEWPVDNDSTFQIFDSDTDGTWEVILWIEPVKK